MPTVKLKIDVSGTSGDEAWRKLRHFDQIQGARFGTQFGSAPATGECKHPGHMHPEGEWVGAEVRVETPLLAQYAMSHYLHQDRVLDADVVD